MVRLVLFLSISLFCYHANAISKCEELYLKSKTGSLEKYKYLIKQYFNGDNRVKNIYIQNVIKDGDWFIINASTDVTDPAYFFFKKNKYIDVWGGVIFPEEKNNTLKWTQEKKVPRDLANCFIDSITIK